MRPEVTESITASALAHGYLVLTSNVDDFKKIPGLEVLVPWRLSENESRSDGKPF